MNSKILLYLPVIHDGYVKFLEKHPGSSIFILDDSLISLIDEEFDYLRKEIRSLKPKQALEALKALFPDREINLLSDEELLKMNSEKEEFILPQEDIFIWLKDEHLSKSKVEFDPTFLRWNRNNSAQKQELEKIGTISKGKFSKKIMVVANKQLVLSSDWWRQVGAVLVKNKKIVAIAHNKHLPTPYTPYIDSDPRNSSHKGEDIDISTAIHAEAALISHAAKKGISLDGAEIFVTTFPCPACAKLIACSGISKLYFTDGYSMVDGDKILKNNGVQIIRVVP